jgi:RNA polymerase sigma-54 factor
MTMGDIAAALGVHESTVSRAVAGKWMDTPRGPREFRSFFTAGLKADGDGAAVSNKAVQERIRALVRAENPAAPLSDAAIAKTLAAEGVTIARRTVAKYRDILHIPSTSERKRR